MQLRKIIPRWVSQCANFIIFHVNESLDTVYNILLSICLLSIHFSTSLTYPSILLSSFGHRYPESFTLIINDYYSKWQDLRSFLIFFFLFFCIVYMMKMYHLYKIKVLFNTLHNPLLFCIV